MPLWTLQSFVFENGAEPRSFDDFSGGLNPQTHRTGLLYEAVSQLEKSSDFT